MMIRTINYLFKTVIMFISPLLIAVVVVGSLIEANNDDYRLYDSRTGYEDARDYLTKTNRYPTSFGPRSLEDEHENLIANSCEPVVFYFFGRHAARFASNEDIDRDNRILLELKERLRQQWLNQPRDALIQSILNWEPTMDPELDKLVTEFGINEERLIARRFKELYPDFFDASKANIKFGNTGKLRTAQTLTVFLNEVDNFYMETSSVQKLLPTNNRHDPDYSIDKILNAPYYKNLLTNHYKEFLDFHRICQKIHGKVKIREPLIELVKEPPVFEAIIRRINAKLGFQTALDNIDNPINSTVVTSIYDACRFEHVSGAQSIWCSLLDRQALEILNFIEDVDSYVKTAYGPNSKSVQSCTLIRDLFESLQEGQQHAGSSSSSTRMSSHFYFSHETNLKKVFATLGLFEDSNNYSRKAIKEYTKTLKAKQDRQWQMSLTCPFSANMAFVLYKCKNTNYKLLTTVNERPVKLAGCNAIQCSIGDFNRKYHKMSSNCDLNKICSKEKKTAPWLLSAFSTGAENTDDENGCRCSGCCL